MTWPPLPNPYYVDDSVALYHGDCREILPELPEGSVDVLITDPPYQSLDVSVSVGTTTRLVRLDDPRFSGKRLTANDGKSWFDTIPDDELVAFLSVQCRRVLAKTGAMYVFSDIKTGLRIFPQLEPANVLTWDKNKIGMGYNWRRQTEWIAYCQNKKHNLRDKGLGDLLRVSGVAQKVHPTEKPTELIETLLDNSSDAGSIACGPVLRFWPGIEAGKGNGAALRRHGHIRTLVRSLCINARAHAPRRRHRAAARDDGGRNMKPGWHRTDVDGVDEGRPMRKTLPNTAPGHGIPRR